MTALDQAFIKAFSQQGTAAAATPPRQAAPASKGLPLSSAIEWGKENLAESRDRRGNVSFDRQVAHAPSSKEIGSRPLSVGDGPWNLQNVESEQWVVGGESWTAETTPWTADTAQPTTAEQPWAEQPWGFGVAAPAAAPLSFAPCSSSPLAPCPVPPVVAASPSAAAVAPSTAVALPIAEPEPSAPTEFKPAWRVDRFTWPRICRRLIGRSAGELDRLADALLTAGDRGQKVLAVAGCHCGKGATTLLLCVARRLTERGIKAVLVDADRARPRLAKRLGVQPQLGWNETSDDDKPLDQAVVEAAANNLALVPFDESTTHGGTTANVWPRLAACIETLRRHYELVLVDPGPLENIESINDALAATPCGKIDAVLLVRNKRTTSEDDLTEIEGRLTAAEIAVVGLIENFVAV